LLVYVNTEYVLRVEKEKMWDLSALFLNYKKLSVTDPLEWYPVNLLQYFGMLAH